MSISNSSNDIWFSSLELKILFFSFCSGYDSPNTDEDTWPEITSRIRKNKVCITSNKTSDYPSDYPPSVPLGKECVFPFRIGSKTYYSCTYDAAHRTNYESWCSTKVDDRGFHIKDGYNWGICKDKSTCPIPPRECGVTGQKAVESLDRTQIDGKIEQHPWVASIGKNNLEDKDGLLWNHECTGSLITNRHVLTAASCIVSFLDDGKRKFKQYGMLVGTSDFTNASRYLSIYGAFQYRQIVNINYHPLYNDMEAYYDVAIAHASKPVEFNDYINAICLPFHPDDNINPETSLTMAGLDFNINPSSTQESKVSLKLTSIEIRDIRRCGKRFGTGNPHNKRLNIVDMIKTRLPKGITDGLQCANFDSDQGKMPCKNDMGSPVVERVDGGARLKDYYQQKFVISKDIECEKLKHHLLVDISNANILRWIQNQTDTQPVLMVYGGYGRSNPSSKTEEQTFLNSVEILSGSKDLVCENHVASVNFKDAKVVGSVGGFANNAVVFCGGGNPKGVSRQCYEYLPLNNKWDTVAKMIKMRIFSSSVRQKEGHMWVLGGVVGENEPTDTEAYSYLKYKTRGKTRNKSEWKKDKPIPGDLNLSGIVGHCSVQINSTHVFLTGGYAPEYRVPAISINFDPLCQSAADNCSTFVSDPLNCAESTEENVDIIWPKDMTHLDFLDEFGIFISDGREKLRLSKVGKVGTCKNILEGGDTTLKKAWIFDGYNWKQIMPPMPESRDRPACTIFESREGRKQILVAGGCKGPCKDEPATKESFIFDLDAFERGDTKNVWNRVADLPIAISNAKMEVLEGLPTIIGGGDGRKKRPNKRLYQYHSESNKWDEHGRIKMKVARASPAVVAVPKAMFSYCFANLEGYVYDNSQNEYSSDSSTDENVSKSNYKRFPL